MKVLLISPFGDGLKGGIASWTGHIMSYYEQNHDDGIELCLLHNRHSKATYATTGIFHRLFNGIYSYIPLFHDFVKATKIERYDVVHICTSASISLLKDIVFARFAHKRGIKTIVHCRFGRIPDFIAANNWENKLFKKLQKYTDLLLVIDMKSYKSLISTGCEHVKYVPNPLALSIQSIISGKGDTSRIPNKIVFVGHVVLTKGVVELVEACSKLKEKKLYIIGPVPDESLKKRLIEIEKKSCSKWLHFSGALSVEKVIEEMLSCSVFALPSYTEGFPNVIIESMACGCPIVTTPVGAIPEMLDIFGNNKCGICVRPKDSKQLSDALQFVLDNPMEARRLGDNARTRVNEEYSMQRVWSILVDTWMNV